MSANNFIFVQEKKKGFKVTMRDADNEVQLDKARNAKTLREAVEIAQAWQDWEDVEYGISFGLLDKKKK